MLPPYIRVDDRDNVAIVLDPAGLTAREHIPQSNKIALKDFEAHEPIIRYGRVVQHSKPGQLWRYTVIGRAVDGEQASCLVEMNGSLIIVTVID